MYHLISYYTRGGVCNFPETSLGVVAYMGAAFQKSFAGLPYMYFS